MAKITKRDLELKLQATVDDLGKALATIEKQAPLMKTVNVKTKEAKVAKTKATKLENQCKAATKKVTELEERVTKNKQSLAKLVTDLSIALQQKAMAERNLQTKDSLMKEQEETLTIITNESHRLILKVVALEQKANTKNPVVVMKHWLESFKQKSNTMYIAVYTITMVLIGITLITSAFGVGSLVKMASTPAAGAWTFTIINTVYIGLIVYTVGELQDWWSKIKEKFNKKNS